MAPDLDKLERAVDIFGYVTIGAFVAVTFSAILIMWIAKHYRKRKGEKRFGSECLFMGTFPILAGLHLPEGMKCNVYCLKSRIVIEANGQEFSLPVEKLVAVDIMTRFKTQKQYVSDAGSAVAGAMTFGALGAYLGGKPELKTIRDRHDLLIFAYIAFDSEKVEYIIFGATENYAALDFTSHFEYLKKQEKLRVDL